MEKRENKPEKNIKSRLLVGKFPEEKKYIDCILDFSDFIAYLSMPFSQLV